MAPSRQRPFSGRAPRARERPETAKEANEASKLFENLRHGKKKQDHKKAVERRDLDLLNYQRWILDVRKRPRKYYT